MTVVIFEQTQSRYHEDLDNITVNTNHKFRLNQINNTGSKSVQHHPDYQNIEISLNEKCKMKVANEKDVYDLRDVV